MKWRSIVIIMTAISLSSCNTHPERALYEGKDISGIGEITRDKHTKETTFTIKTEGKWKLYTAVQVDLISHHQPLLEGEGSGRYTLRVPYIIRNYYQLVTDEGKAVLAEHQLPMEGGYNFRDLGGMKTKDGRFVKWGKLFRSDDLRSLTPSDLDYLSSIPLVSVVDFRSESEREQAPDKVPASVKHRYDYSINPGNLNSTMNLSAMSGEANLDSLMENINRELVTDPAIVRRYKDFFSLLQDESQQPLLFHCSAGKDRTGMGAALILLALGVDEEQVMQDYLLSNIYLKDKYAGLIKELPLLAPLFGVKYKYLKAGLDQIRETYGSIHQFIEGTLSVDIARFKEMYLY